MADPQEGASAHWEGEENIPGADERHAHAPSDVDAMGNPKRRQVVGKRYGASLQKQATVYGIALALIIAVVIVFLTVVTSIDDRDIDRGATAPWAQEEAPVRPPLHIDFPADGSVPIEREWIGRAVIP